MTIGFEMWRAQFQLGISVSSLYLFPLQEFKSDCLEMMFWLSSQEKRMYSMLLGEGTKKNNGGGGRKGSKSQHQQKWQQLKRLRSKPIKTLRNTF